uniref:Uncharacterized protein n=1 Tax=Anguilla anguilla TaxID=7936 RepID=A0A0E9XQA5_ANGAN
MLGHMINQFDSYGLVYLSSV